jgi:hypothetical protein
MRAPEHARFPILYDRYHRETPDGKPDARTVHWQFTPERQIAGPYEIGFYAPTSAVATELGSIAADPAGTLMMTASGSVQVPGGKSRWEHRLLRQEPGGLPEPAADVDAALGEAEAVYWSNLFNGFIISGVVKE